MTKSKIIFLLAGVATITGVWIHWRPAKRFEFAAPDIDEFRVVTWNVGYFSATKDKNLKDIDIGFIAKTIREIEADVVVLQELSSTEQPDKIANEIGTNWKSYSVETGHGNQVLSIFTPLACDETSEVECGGRKVLLSSLQSRLGEQVCFIGVHSPHPGRGMDDTIANIECTLALASERNENVRIFAGDMNYNFDPEDPNGELYQKIREKFGDSTIALGETYYAHTRIDHVFHYPAELSIVEETSGMIDMSMRLAKVPGFRDHRPIVITYKLDETKAEKVSNIQDR